MSIKIYTTPTCPYCTMAKKYFDSKNIGYENVDVTGDKQAAQEMIDKSGQRGVPVVEIDGNIIVGFDKEKIESYMK